MDDVKRYEIGGSTYEQRPLVFGQWQQFSREIKGLDLPAELTQRNLIEALADRLDRLLAIALTPEGTRPQNKDRIALAQELAFSMTPEQVSEVVNDFFTCNPVASIIEMLAGITEAMATKLSSRPSSCCAGETSAKPTMSAGT